ncbi:phosphate signaling complex protein PhoU [Gluconacetobacter takamatsuzukensis]|uniref:Phosphate-specific transport system accessory protein PhoU n=1 Tax=Gluconacetobacter takamatsuzukensis TaxID=1286190 RepID=A0A7W4KFS8_9PROT|nr:phosphate signaling complex protein PhoU [Gluconacetobacter takamatsuzukensis]MBB2206132.1 phosphate signaling complex protein PhoU [Gluconacetobacter takamatsuzukensis]
MVKEQAHTVSRYEQQLAELRDMMVAMGRLVTRQTEQAVAAVVEGDTEAGRAAQALDPQVDQLERDIETLAIRLLALRAPMAGDLREIVAAMKISGDLERIGDCAASVAKRALKVDAVPTDVPAGALRSMGRLVQENLRRAIDALDQRDSARAVEVWQSDAAVDELYTAMFRELVTYMMEDPRTIRSCTHLLFIAKNLERIGDHATNIAERVYYAATGEMLPTERPRGGASVR